MTSTVTRYRVYLVHHGETSESAKGLVQGWHDSSLNEKGLVQADLLGVYFQQQGVNFDSCFTSDLKRSSRTAGIILSKSIDKSLKVVPDKRLRERFFGDWQGRPIEERDSAGSVTNVEPLIVFSGRLLNFWDELLSKHLPRQSEQAEGQDQTSPVRSAVHNVLVSTHAGPIRTLVTDLINGRKYTLKTGVSLGHRVGHCSLTVIALEPLYEKRKGVVEVYALETDFEEVQKGDAEMSDMVGPSPDTISGFLNGN